MTNNPDPLRECPFCGASADNFALAPYQTHNFGGEPKDWTVECAECAAFGPTANTKAEAIAAWNRRPLPSPPASGDRT